MIFYLTLQILKWLSKTRFLQLLSQISLIHSLKIVKSVIYSKFAAKLLIMNLIPMMIKKCIFNVILCFALLNVAFGQNDVLMKVGNAKVSLSEFKYIYEKNNANKADFSANSINEYLDLYTKFKLKVEKARAMRLDTISALQSELQGYRKQLSASYLIDKGVTDYLMKELYDRMKYDVSFSHIFAPVAETASQKDKDAAKAKLAEAIEKVKGGMKFEEAARMYSGDKVTAAAGGDMGYFTAKLPNGFYGLESALYNSPKGKISDIIETRIGYHVVRVNDKRPAVGTVEVAHILVPTDKKLLADSIERLVRSGSSWEDLVVKYSIDKTSNRNGGKLPPFGINTYEKSFENAAFFLTTDSKISAPVMSKNGWHIIKLIQKMSQDPYDIFVKKMKANINKDQRFDAAKYSLINDIKKTSGAMEDKTSLPAFVALLNEDFYTIKWTPNDNLPTKPIFTIGGDRKYSLIDFAKYCKGNTKYRLKFDKTKPLSELVNELYAEFVNEKALDFEESNLEIKYPEFKSLVKEYDEGILLFEATKINVWDKANTDSIGLMQFYKASPNRYQWPEKAEVAEVTVTTADTKLSDKIWKLVQKKGVEAAVKKFNKKEKVVSYKLSEYEKGSKEIADLGWSPNLQSPRVKDSNNPNVYAFKRINKIMPSRAKTLEEARGYVVADYQDFLEKGWVKSLEAEFPVVINKDVLAKLIK
jgi:peptidyl-prolyl cis-trans isomerase SurA